METDARMEAFTDALVNLSAQKALAKVTVVDLLIKNEFPLHNTFGGMHFGQQLF